MPSNEKASAHEPVNQLRERIAFDLFHVVGYYLDLMRSNPSVARLFIADALEATLESFAREAITADPAFIKPYLALLARLEHAIMSTPPPGTPVH